MFSFTVLYTSDKAKKAKKWHDGTLRSNLAGTRVCPPPVFAPFFTKTNADIDHSLTTLAVQAVLRSEADVVLDRYAGIDRDRHTIFLSLTSVVVFYIRRARARSITTTPHALQVGMEVESEKYLIQIDSVADPSEGAGDAAGQAADPSPSLREESPSAAAPWANSAPGLMRTPGVGLRRRPPNIRFTPPIPSAEHPTSDASAAATTVPAWQPPLVASPVPAPARSALEILSLLTGAAAPPQSTFPQSDASAPPDAPAPPPLDAHVWGSELSIVPATQAPRPPAKPLRRVGPLSRMRPVLRPDTAAMDTAASVKENQVPTLRRPYSNVSAAVEDDGDDHEDGCTRGKRMAEFTSQRVWVSCTKSYQYNLVTMQST